MWKLAQQTNLIESVLRSVNARLFGGKAERFSCALECQKTLCQKTNSFDTGIQFAKTGKLGALTGTIPPTVSEDGVNRDPIGCKEKQRLDILGATENFDRFDVAFSVLSELPEYAIAS